MYHSLLFFRRYFLSSSPDWYIYLVLNPVTEREWYKVLLDHQEYLLVLELLQRILDMLVKVLIGKYKFINNLKHLVMFMGSIQ